MKKKILSVLLALSMVFSLIPVTALAEEGGDTSVTSVSTLSELQTAIASGVTSIELTKAITVTSGEVTIEAEEPVTITTSVTDAFTVSGGTLTLGANITVNSNTSILWAHNGGKIIVDGATLNSTGSKYNLAFAEGTNASISVVSGTLVSTGSNSVTLSLTSSATATISGGKISSDTTSAVCAQGGAVFTVNGGIVETTASGVLSAAYSTNKGKIIVKGGAVNNYTSGTNTSASLIAVSGGIVEMSGGSVNKGVLAWNNGSDNESAETSVTISGGNIIGAVSARDKATLTITGGTFGTLEALDYLVDGKEIEIALTEDVALGKEVVIDNGTKVTIEAEKPVTITTSVIDAFTVNGGTLTLGANITVNSSTSILYAHGGGKIIVDGAKLTATGSPYALAFATGDGSSISVVDGGSLVCNDTNKVTLDLQSGATATISGGTISSNGSSAVCAQSGAVFTVEGGTVETTASGVLSAAYSTSGGKIFVKGGAVNNYASESNTSASLIAVSGGTVEMTGGSVNKGVLAWNNGTENESAGTSAAISGGNIIGAVSARDKATLTITGGTFGTLEALDYLVDGKEIEIALTENVTLGKSVVIDNDTKVTIEAEEPVTITTSVTDVFEVSGGTLTLGANITVNSNTSILWAHDGGKIIVDGANLTATGSPYALAFAEEEGSSISVVNGGSLVCNDTNKVTLDLQSGATATISGGTISSNGSSAVCAQSGAVFTVEGGTVETTASGVLSAAYSTSGGKIFVKGGAVNNYASESNTSASLIAVSGGIVEMFGGSVNKGVLAWNNGTENASAGTSAAISGGNIVGYVSARDKATLTITGGSFSTEPSADYIGSGYDCVYTGTAYIVAQPYTITFDANGGTIDDPTAVTAPTTCTAFTVGGKLSSLPTPTRSGYTFKGWYTAASGGTEVTTNTVFDGDTTVYAQWTAIEYTVTFDANGGTCETASATTENGKLSSLPTATRSGYTFNGWYTAASGGTEVTTDTVFTDNTTVYAQWTAVSTGGDSYVGGSVGGSSSSSNDKTDVTTETETTVNKDGSVTETTTTTETVKNKDGSVTETTTVVEATENVDGSSVTSEVVTETITNADGTSETVTTETVTTELADGTVETVVTDSTGKMSGTVEMPADVVGKLVEAAVESGQTIEIVMSNGMSIELDAAGLNEQMQLAGGTDVTVSIIPHEDAKLTQKQQNSVGERPAYDISVTSGGNYISKVGSKITITVPYELKSGEAARGIVVYYVDDNGNRERCETSYNEKNKCVSWQTGHLSLYMLDYDEELAKVCDGGVSCPVSAFIDADSAAWYHDGVHYCLENGLMNGLPGSLFDPNGTTTRAQIVTILWRLEGEPVVDYLTQFEDVASDAWYAEAVCWAASENIVGGYGDGNFGSNDAITREQMATIFFRYCQYKGIDVSVGEDTNILSYTDAVTVSEYAIPAMQWACGAGLIGGIADGDSLKLDPVGSATRAQVATILWRFCELNP